MTDPQIVPEEVEKKCIILDAVGVTLPTDEVRAFLESIADAQHAGDAFYFTDDAGTEHALLPSGTVVTIVPA